MLVFETIGDQMVLAYTRIGRHIVLYVVVIVSFCFPDLVDVSALSMLVVLFALSCVVLMCSP